MAFLVVQALAFEIAVKLCRKHPLLIDISGATLARLCRQNVQPEDQLSVSAKHSQTWDSYAKRFPAWVESFHGTSDIYDQSIRAAVQLSLDALDPEALSLLMNMPLEAFSQVRATLDSLFLQFVAVSCFRFAWPGLCCRA